MISRRTAIVLVVITFLTGLLARLPAGVVLGWVLPPEIATRGIEGTVWSGSMAALEVNEVGVGPIQWRLSALALLTGTARADIEAQLPGGFFDGVVSAGMGGTIRILDAGAQFALGPVTRYSEIGPSTGTARLRINEMTVQQQTPQSIDGELTLVNLVYPPVSPTLVLGDHRLVFAPDSGNDQYPMGATVESLSGPFDIAGRFFLSAEREYSMRASLALQPDAPAQLRDNLRFLGTPDASGRVPLDYDGSF